MKRASRSPAVSVISLTGIAVIGRVGRVDAHIARHAGCARRRADDAQLLGDVVRHRADAARALQEHRVSRHHVQVVVRALFQKVQPLEDRVVCRASISHFTPPSTLAE